MSKYKIPIKTSKAKINKEKYNIFNDFLNNLDKYTSMGNSSNQNYNINNLLSNKINISKHTKIDGSKNFLLNITNSCISKNYLNKNLDNAKTIMDNLDFLSTNSKYINTIQHQQHNVQKNNNKINELFSFNSSLSCSSHKNLFFTNKKNYQLNLNSSINSDINSSNYNLFTNKSNANNENIFNNILENTLENSELNKELINKDNDISLCKTQANSSFSLYRQDYYVKQFKVQYSIWLRNILNQKLKLLITETKTCRRHLKFYPLNSLKFTANPKYEDNKYFLSLKIKEILVVGIDGIKSSNQRKNKENIETIENIIYKQNKNANDDLLKFLNITMEESIKIFYKSEQFLKFKESQQAKLNDRKFEQEKNFSLLKEYGFIHLIKNYKGNAKSTISFNSNLE